MKKTYFTDFLAPEKKQLIAYITGAFFVFVLGFFLLFGKEARLSGSWKYVMNHDDEYSYWMYAKGASETPMSDGNPFFFEQIGTRHSIPYTTCNIVGFLAKTFHVSVLFFFPIWHIGAPFILWLVLFLCLWKFWAVPIRTSALFSILILLSTLLIDGQPRLTLLRFSRPADGLWLLIIWISIIMNSEFQKKSHLIIASSAAFFSVFFHPIYALYGAIATTGEAIWQAWFQKNKKKAISLAVILAASAIAFCFYFIWITSISHTTASVLMIKDTESSYVILKYIMTAIVFYSAIITLINTSCRYFQLPLSKLDRLMLFCFSSEFLLPFFHYCLGGRCQLYAHRYYFFIIELACLVAWASEKVHALVLRKKNHSFVAVALFILFGIILNVGERSLNIGSFQLPLSGLDQTHPPIDTSLFFLELLAPVFVCVWIVQRFSQIKKVTGHPFFLTLLTLTITCYGFTNLPSQFKTINTNFPFDGAYNWLNKNAAVNDVVLTIPPKYRRTDYLVLRTNLKTYENEYGDILLKTEKNKNQGELRVFIHAAILMDKLDKFSEVSSKNFLRRFKLDYILLNRPSPFQSTVEKQLNPLLEKVYEDERCLLWKLKLAPLPIQKKMN